MTEDQWDALLAWCNRFDMRLERLEREIAAVKRWNEPIPFAPEPRRIIETDLDN